MGSGQVVEGRRLKIEGKGRTRESGCLLHLFAEVRTPTDVLLGLAFIFDRELMNEPRVPLEEKPPVGWFLSGFQLIPCRSQQQSSPLGLAGSGLVPLLLGAYLARWELWKNPKGVSFGDRIGRWLNLFGVLTWLLGDILHVCLLWTFYIFAYCGLVVEIQIHLTA